LPVDLWPKNEFQYGGCPQGWILEKNFYIWSCDCRRVSSGLLCTKCHQNGMIFKPPLVIASTGFTHWCSPSVPLFVCLSVFRQNPYTKIQFSQKLSSLELWYLLMTIGSPTWAVQKTHYWIRKIQDCADPPSWKSSNHHISRKNHPILMKFDIQLQIRYSMTVTWQSHDQIQNFLKFKMADGRHIATH